MIPKKAAHKDVQKDVKPMPKMYYFELNIAKLMPRVRKKCLEGHTARAVRSPADTKGAHGWWHTVLAKNVFLV